MTKTSSLIGSAGKAVETENKVVDHGVVVRGIVCSDAKELYEKNKNNIFAYNTADAPCP